MNTTLTRDEAVKLASENLVKSAELYPTLIFTSRVGKTGYGLHQWGGHLVRVVVDEYNGRIIGYRVVEVDDDEVVEEFIEASKELRSKLKRGGIIEENKE